MFEMIILGNNFVAPILKLKNNTDNWIIIYNSFVVIKLVPINDIKFIKNLTLINYIFLSKPRRSFPS